MPLSYPNLKQETDFHIVKLYNHWLMAIEIVVGRGEYKLTGTFSYLFKVTEVEPRITFWMNINSISLPLKACDGVGAQIWWKGVWGDIDRAQTDIVPCSCYGVDCNCHFWPFDMINYINKFPRNWIPFISRLNSLHHSKTLSWWVLMMADVGLIKLYFF